MAQCPLVIAPYMLRVSALCSGRYMEIKIDDLSGSEIAEFLADHIVEMKSVSPPESKHALDLEGLRRPEITFWSVWKGDQLIGCGALKELSKLHGEIKSMRVLASSRGEGVASYLLRHLLKTATERGYHTISLETGSMAFFEPARRLYKKFDFADCPAFGDYKKDPNSVFMSRSL
jgi:putative acetyltransferase